MEGIEFEMKRPHIVLFSGKAQNGKDTSVAIFHNYMEKRGYRTLRIAMADYLKFIAGIVYGWDGQKDAKGRNLLQTIAEVYRKRDINFWVDQAIHLTNMEAENYDFILVSDFRHKNEIARWIAEGFKTTTVRVSRPGFDNGLTFEQKNHISEVDLDDYSFDFYFEASSVDELDEKIKAWTLDYFT